MAIISQEQVKQVNRNENGITNHIYKQAILPTHLQRKRPTTTRIHSSNNIQTLISNKYECHVIITICSTHALIQCQ